MLYVVNVHPVYSIGVGIRKGIVWDTLVCLAVLEVRFIQYRITSWLWREIWNWLWQTAMNTSEVLYQTFGLNLFITQWLQFCVKSVFVCCLSTGTWVHYIVINSNRQQTLRHLIFLEVRVSLISHKVTCLWMSACLKMATTWTYMMDRKNTGGWSVW